MVVLNLNEIQVMEFTENDLLFTNEFIRKPDLSGTVTSRRATTSFENYYISQNKKLIDPDRNSQIQLDSSDVGKRYQRQVKTFVSVDSRDRDTILYPKPSNFKIFLGKTFYNVRSVRLATIEFPNTDAVINSSNNKIHWINKEDIEIDLVDNITMTYPVYSVDLRIGSYIASKLQAEIDDKMKSVKRRNKTGDSHFIFSNLDIETDVVTFTSLIIKQLGINPLSTLASTGLVKVTANDHGYTTGDSVYILNARLTSGISSAFLNQAHTITVLNEDEFVFETSEKSINTEDGGGSNIKSGKLAPFQLLFGDYPDNVSKNIGYLRENSSEQIVVSVKSMDNFYQSELSLVEPHGLTINDVGKIISISSSGTTPSIDGTRIVSGIINERTLLVNINSTLSIPSFNQGVINIDSSIFNLSRIQNFRTNTIIVQTFHKHNYSLSDIGMTINIYNSISQPSFDGTNILFMVISDTEFVIYGEILTGGGVNVTEKGEAGYIPLQKPLTSEHYTISLITPGIVTTIQLSQPHDLKIGDLVKVYNVNTSPSIALFNNGVHEVFGVIDSNTFTLNYRIDTIDNDSINVREAFIGTSIATLNFPDHGFNTIVNISNDVPGSSVSIQTLLNHNFTTGDTVRISSSDTVPSIDDGGYIVTVISPDTFTIPFLVALQSEGTYGVIGISTQFSLYRAESFGGFKQDVLNNVKFKIRDVKDEDNFTFDILNNYSTELESDGGTGIFINSFLHGFNGVQTNTKNGVIDRSISLEGENYTFLTCPQLSTMKNTGSVTDVFARITLDQSPGMMIFNFLSNPKQFDDVPLNKLDELEFSMVNFNNTFYEFNDLDYSMTLEITEIVDADHSFNISSRRGIADTL